MRPAVDGAQPDEAPSGHGPPTRSAAFAPGRVNLIGEHTDYNQGLALPFAIAEGVTVTAVAAPRDSPEAAVVRAFARDVRERDAFPLAHPEHTRGWRAFVRGIVAELTRAGCPLTGANVEIVGEVPRGAGLSSSAALEVALCLALSDLGARADGGEAQGEGGDGLIDGGVRGGDTGAVGKLLGRREMARLCARVENEWAGAHTGLLDQLASLYGARDAAMCIDFRTLDVQQVPLLLGEWRLVVLDSGERHLHASSGYNERRAECARACKLLGVSSLRDAQLDAAQRLPDPLRGRAVHVIEENERVREAVRALRDDDLPALGPLLDASHRSLRDDFEVSTPAVELAVQRLRDAGASGARLVGGGFGGSVLGLFAPGATPPADAREVRPGPGARLLDPDAVVSA
ncbi:MAG TPA: galactokinase family protein [Solirubrobacteraceae bacterium]|nr:galactokinase family protein [Solirubrobacteraceae bacterium]